MTAPALPMSVAIVNFNTRDVLDECLASVMTAATMADRYEELCERLEGRRAAVRRTPS